MAISGQCSAQECSEAAVTSADERALCRKHFLLYSYQRLQGISAEIHEPQFHERRAEAAGHFLEDCMREAADIACAPVTPTNLERAQVLDVLLWASELHGRLRRGPRVPAKMPVLLRCESSDHPWEEKTETQLLSRHGAQVACRHDVSANDRLICVRLDNGWRTEARVAWVSRKGSGELEVGLDFITDTNFWGLGANAAPRTSEEPSSRESTPTSEPVGGSGDR